MKIFLVLLLLESYIRKSNALRLVHCHGKELRTESSQMSLKCDRNSDIAISNTTCQLFCSKSYDPEIRFFKCNRGGWFPVAKPSCIQDSSVTMKTVPAVLGSIFLLFMFSCGFAMYKRKMKRKEERDEDLEAGKRRHHYLKRNPKLAKDLSDVRKKIKAEDSVEVVDEMRSQSIKSLDVPKKRMKKKRMWRLNPRKMKMKFGRFKSRFRQKFRRRSESSEMTSDEESEWEFESSEEDTDDEKDVETEEKIEEDKELAIINKILVENLVFNEKKDEENGEEKEKKREEEEKKWERRKRKEEDKKRRDLKKDEDEKRERSRRRKKRKLNPYEDYSSSGFNERRYHNFENDYRRQEHHYERGFYQRTTNPIEYFPIKSGKIKPPKKEAKKKVKQDDDVESSQRGGVKYFAIKPRSTDLKREENRGPSKYSPRKLVETKKVSNDIQRVIREKKRHPGRRKEQQKRRKGKYESRSPSRRRKSGKRKDQDRERSHRRHRDASSKKKRSKRSSNRRS